MIVTNRLKDILKERGLKQVWLAEQIGVTRGTISNIINNRYATTLELAFKISKVLNMNLTEIFYYEDEKILYKND